uniref:Methyltransferase domain-containing protein n=1 Tax=Kalmanozyma brasiliensis (strain GHG001) TaxID=1365824 RepID=V5EMQ5_KALBG
MWPLNAEKSSSYIGGDGLSPTSTTSTDPTTKASLAGSSGSSANAAALPHKLPDLEHFRQSSQLMPEYFPRTSEFFSHGRRRSSVAINPNTPATTGTSPSGAAPAIPEASLRPRSSASPAKKPDSFNLPLNFEESEALLGEQLPVRLGLAPPSHSHGFKASDITYKARVGHGYYFYLPPPLKAAPSANPAPDTLRRRNTDTGDHVGWPLQQKVPSPSSTQVSPIALGSSAQRARASTSTDASPAPTLTRVKGKMHEYVYHSFPSSVAPYWHGYNNEAMEAELSLHLSIVAIFRGHTLREFPEGSRPSRVLDLGCGRGQWCLDVAREWKTTEFVGLDLVPIQPPLHKLGDPDLEHRVSWVVANFLEPLPFPDASFDYVHIRFLLQGVPEDKWVDIFSEARRVLAPGGVLEILESNYIFFGQPSLVDTGELDDLEKGRAALKISGGARMPRRLKVLGDASDSNDVDAIEVVFERMMHRRFINPASLSIMASALLLPGFATVANGNPRHIPVFAESKAQRARARGETTTSSSNATSSDDEYRRSNKFASRGQIGPPLKSQFAVTDAELICALAIMERLDHFSSSRELVWAEAEAEKRSLQGTPQVEVPKMDATRRFGQGNPMALKPFAHPWKSKQDFFKAMDTWIETTRVSADTESLLLKYLDWEQTHEDLTVEGRKHAERRRKMSSSSVTMPSLGLDRLNVDNPLYEEHGGASADGGFPQKPLASWQEETPGDVGMEYAGRSAYPIPSTRAQEAPARLQSTRSSASDTRPDVAHSAEPNKPVEKKKRKSMRPSSSGSVGLSTPSFGGSFGRARTFGRGGAGNLVAAQHVPLPDAPSFMPGNAFVPPGSDAHGLFRGANTKASILASTRGGRGGPGGRLASSTKSITSDQASIPSRDDPRQAATGMVSSPAPLSPASGMSAAAAYAATQRVSHGIDDEHRFQPVPGIPEEEVRRESRPVSPTTGALRSPVAPARASTTGTRPSLTSAHPGAGAGADARSVTSPPTAGATVRIAEPLNKPSKDRSAKIKPKAVAIIGFLDASGFLATA